MSWLLSRGLDALSSLRSGFTPTYLTFPGELQVVTTALLAEGGYSFVYAAREEGLTGGGRQFALKKVLAQGMHASAACLAHVVGAVAPVLDLMCPHTRPRSRARAQIRTRVLLPRSKRGSSGSSPVIRTLSNVTAQSAVTRRRAAVAPNTGF